MRVLAWIVLATFVAGCTKDLVRGPMDTRNFTVDLERLGARRVVVNGLEMDSVVLTPAQWPLEASFKNLFQGDFSGTIENFDLSFRASRLRNDTLERLFDEGYLPAFLRVPNCRRSDQFNCRFRPRPAIDRACQCCTAAFALRPFVHLAAFWRLFRRYADKVRFRCMCSNGSNLHIVLAANS